MGKQWKQCQTLFVGAPKSLQMVTAAMSRQILTPSKDQAFSWINRAITSPNTVDILSTQYQLVIGDVGGECNFLSSVLPQQRFEMMDQCYSLVTAQSFIWQAKVSTPSRREGWQPQRWGLNPSWLPSFVHLSPPHWACPMQIGLAKKGVCLFHPKFSLWSAGFLLFCFPGLSLSLSFRYRHFGLLFPILTT